MTICTKCAKEEKYPPLRIVRFWYSEDEHLTQIDYECNNGHCFTEQKVVEVQESDDGNEVNSSGISWIKYDEELKNANRMLG